MLSYFELKEIIKLQILCSFSYTKGVPRSLFFVPIVFREALAFDETFKNIYVYNIDHAKVKKHSLGTQLTDMLPMLA